MKRAFPPKPAAVIVAAAAGLLAAGCGESGGDPPPTEPPGPVVTPANHSVTPALVKNVMAGVQVYSLLSSDDQLAGSPAYVFGGFADGMGVLKNADGTFTALVNHEEELAVSRVTFDATFKPVRGEYVLTSDAGRWRLCSATLATPEEHGFGPVFLTVGESGVESMIQGIDPYGAPNTPRLFPALGRWNSENAVPLPKDAFQGRTVVVIGDDDAGPAGGQVAMYVGPRGDLESGRVYVLARADGNQRERDMVVGQGYPVVFREIPAATQLFGGQINTMAVQVGAVMFGRVEDLDYRKGGGGREVFFNVTGQSETGPNADRSRSKYGRVYRLVLDEADPTRGTLELLLDGDDRNGPARTFQNPDNLVATENFLYVQEDPGGYGDETHDAYVYQYDLRTRQLRVLLELDHRRGEAQYNVGGPSRPGSWEYGAMVDVSGLLGIEGAFLLNVQPHTWTGERYRNPDGGTTGAPQGQGSQVLLLTGVPR